MVTILFLPPSSGRQHVLNVDLVKRLNSETLMKRLLNQGVSSPAQTRTMIRQKMANEDGDDIAPCDLRVSIQCPISKTRIRKPCRATTCRHVQVCVWVSQGVRKREGVGAGVMRCPHGGGRGVAEIVSAESILMCEACLITSQPPLIFLAEVVGLKRVVLSLI